MSWNVLMCTGNFKRRSHVDDVGRHLQLSMQPCTKETENFFEKPRTGTVFVPVIHFTNVDIDTSPVE